MRILLYKPNTVTAFAMYANPCEIAIDKETKIVKIIDLTKVSGSDSNPIIKQYRLVKKSEPVWTDNTKNQEEILVKLVVDDLKQMVDDLK